MDHPPATRHSNPRSPHHIPLSQHFQKKISKKMGSQAKMEFCLEEEFEDMLPKMAEKLGGEGLIGELCNGFNLLMDKDKGVITFESLKRGSSLLGLQDLRDEELMNMLKEGDYDGDGALNQMEFCVLMFRLSPELMMESEALLDHALQQEFESHVDLFHVK